MFNTNAGSFDYSGWPPSSFFLNIFIKEVDFNWMIRETENNYQVMDKVVRSFMGFYRELFYSRFITVKFTY